MYIVTRPSAALHAAAITKLPPKSYLCSYINKIAALPQVIINAQAIATFHAKGPSEYAINYLKGVLVASHSNLVGVDPHIDTLTELFLESVSYKGLENTLKEFWVNRQCVIFLPCAHSTTKITYQAELLDRYCATVLCKLSMNQGAIRDRLTTLINARTIRTQLEERNTQWQHAISSHK
ncbi:hypothetical protein SOPP22_01985 [Shewanella sp. OPT22]|nr:hypothetical protein SOPP22_01985 [Shewanella sp. OPT22]